MVVTGPGGRIVRGRSTLDKAQALSFAPVRPLAAGKYTVEVHLHESPAEDTVLDSWSFAVKPSSTLSNGSGGSILLVAREGTRDTYVTEILRAEGFTGFDTVSPEHLSRDVLADHAIVILGPGVRRDRIFATWSRGSGAAVI